MSRYLYYDKQEGLLYKFNENNNIAFLLSIAAAVLELESAQSDFLVRALHNDHILNALVFLLEGVAYTLSLDRNQENNVFHKTLHANVGSFTFDE